MISNQDLLDQCEEFFCEIQNEDENVDIDFAIDSLRTMLERDVDGWTGYGDEDLAYAVQSRLEEIWEMIPASEKSTDLAVYYEEIMRELESVSDFEANLEDEYFDDGDES